MLNEQHKQDVILLGYIKVTLSLEEGNQIAPSEWDINRVQVLSTANKPIHLKGS
jgi:hypothetical protein